MSISSRKSLSTICPIMLCFLHCLSEWFRGLFCVCDISPIHDDISPVHVTVSVGQTLLYQSILIVLLFRKRGFQSLFPLSSVHFTSVRLFLQLLVYTELSSELDQLDQLIIQIEAEAGWEECTVRLS